VASATKATAATKTTAASMTTCPCWLSKTEKDHPC
jgi:hypothetical protein